MLNELKPEDVMKALAWYEVVGKNIGSVTIPYNELQAIAAFVREKDARIKELEEAQGAEFTCFVGEPHKVDHCPYVDELVKKDAEIEHLETNLKQYENTCGKLIVRDNDEVVGFIEGQEKTYINKDIARVLRTMAVDTARNKAITEFAERLKQASYADCTITGYRHFIVDIKDIDQIAKEMKGVKDDIKKSQEAT